MPLEASLLAWRDLALRYPGGPSLAFADLTLQRGQHLLLRGASGSGKSSLIALLAGLLRPSRGEVWLAGEALSSLGSAACDALRGRWLGVLPQRLHLCAALSVHDNLRLPFVAVGEPEPAGRVVALAERLGLQALLARRPHALSGGQLQRVALARALVREPPLLLLDEPSSSLDDAAAATLLDLVVSLAHERSVSLLVATHDARVVTRLGAQLGPTLQTLDLGGAA